MLVIFGVFFTVAQQPQVGQDLLIIEDSWSHSDTPHSVRLLWTSDQLDAETTTWQDTTLATDKQTFMPPAVFKPTVSASERPQTHALDPGATGTDNGKFSYYISWYKVKQHCPWNNRYFCLQLARRTCFIKRIWRNFRHLQQSDVK